MSRCSIERSPLHTVGPVAGAALAALTVAGCYLAHERLTPDAGPRRDGADPRPLGCRLAPIESRGWPMWGARADRSHRTGERAPTGSATVTYDVDLGLESAVDLVAAPDGVVFLPIDDEMVAVAPDGTIAWRVDLGARATRAPIVLEDGTLLANAGEHLALLSRADGSTLRTIALPGSTYDPVVLDGDLVLHLAHPARIARVGCDSAVVYEISAAAGEFPAAPVALDDSGRAHLATAAATDTYRTVLLAVERDGSAAYRVELDGYLTGGPAIAPSGALYVMVGRGLALDAHFLEIDREGRVVRDLDLGEQAFTAPAPLAIDETGRAFVRTWESLLVITPDEGRAARAFNHPNLVYAIAVGADGYVLRTSGNFQLLDRESLAVSVEIDPPAPSFCVGGTAVAAGRFYATACDGHAIALGPPR